MSEATIQKKKQVSSSLEVFCSSVPELESLTPKLSSIQLDVDQSSFSSIVESGSSWKPSNDYSSEFDRLVVQDSNICSNTFEAHYAARSGHSFGLTFDKQHKWRFHSHKSEVHKIIDAVTINKEVHFKARWKSAKKDPSQDLWLNGKGVKNCRDAVDDFISDNKSLLKKKFEIGIDVTGDVSHYFLIPKKIEIVWKRKGSYQPFPNKNQNTNKKRKRSKLDDTDFVGPRNKKRHISPTVSVSPTVSEK